MTKNKIRLSNILDILIKNIKIDKDTFSEEQKIVGLFTSATEILNLIEKK